MIVLTHVLVAILLWKILGHFWPIFIGAVLLDLDHIFVFIIKGVYNPIKMLQQSAECHKYGSHRTMLHSLLGLFISFLVLAIIDLEFASYFIIGMASHLILDLLDGNGTVPILYPIMGDLPGLIKLRVVTELAIGLFILYIFLL
jgi:hypothetical protein